MTDKAKQQQHHLDASHGVDVTPHRDGGVRKKVVKEGSGDETPLPGDRVFVHYVGSLLDGTKFDSSRDRNKLFDFKIGKGTVIKAWDIGVETMKQGEVAQLTCTPDYAYGDTGSGPVIGPFATLVFEIELFRWEGEDISEHKDGGVIRRLLQKGEGHNTPNSGATVKAHICGKCLDSVFDDRDVHFTVGEGDKSNICPGLEQALKKMKLKEHSRFKIKSNYAFGQTGKPEWKIPANTDVVYEVKMNSFERAKELWELDPDDRIREAESSKDEGGGYFKAGDFCQAATSYKRVLSVLEHENSDIYKTQCESLRLAAHLNLALCYLKLEKYHEAEIQCNHALTIEKNSVKGLYRRAQARLHKKEYESAMEDFQAVLKVDPNNKAARKELNLATQKLKQFRDTEKKIYAGMFSKFAAKEPAPSGHRYTNSGEDVFQTVDEWNNDMAKDMMSLEQELEAFGEKMPDKHEKGKKSETNKQLIE